jgi:hypothetical protein
VSAPSTSRPAPVGASPASRSRRSRPPCSPTRSTSSSTRRSGLGFDPSTAQVVIEAYPIDDEVEIVSEESEDGIEIEAVVEIPEPAELFQVKIPVGTARAFVERTREVVAAGRPPGDA